MGLRKKKLDSLPSTEQKKLWCRGEKKRKNELEPESEKETSV